ncbi:sulfurtransferase complex subunit TusB [Vibrio sp. SCSIO 43135]|uniref:Sulfurtransferase complex subunit TusB n=1 Tax=Vibrio paucivorans TaxID=2829489 RepID=A0A9X3CFV7_9VIBR|nr:MULTISPECIES: sulfurtransferase complex subunit TusB [Vibrio]MCW8335087.1 sulfurtransferase complex subunit TusB [Vibrio paucivorans]USD40877.1 sulfurtransferase complex subunit TusB [Vibrio sp. SCSIO 43135]
MLHIIKSISALDDMLALYAAEDDVLLVEDAVYVVNPQHQAFNRVKGLSLFALQSDLEARGIANRVSPSVSVVSYAGFVDLTAKQHNSLTWD